MDVFCKFVTCYRQGTIGWAFGDIILYAAATIAVYAFADSCRHSTLVPRCTGYAVGSDLASSGILLWGTVLFRVYIPATTPDLARSTGDSGDYIILSVDYGIFLGTEVCILFSVNKSVTAPPASYLARSTRVAGDDIVARASDGSKKSNVVTSDAAICSGVRTGSCWRMWRRGSRRWADTFDLDWSVLRQPIGPVTEYVSWEGYLGRPMKQRRQRTCALIAGTVAVEATNRFVHASSYGEGSPFPWVVAEPLDLLKMCRRRRIWNKRTGAYVRDVLEVIRKRGGMPLANPSAARTILPLTGWQEYSANTGVHPTQDLVAKLLTGGPCIVILWVCPWYHLFDASRNDAWVYRGCGRSQQNRDKSKLLYGKMVSSHAVVCLGYRRCGDQIHVLVLDNHSDHGPRRWVDAGEIDAIYTLTVR